MQVQPGCITAVPQEHQRQIKAGELRLLRCYLLTEATPAPHRLPQLFTSPSLHQGAPGTVTLL